MATSAAGAAEREAGGGGLPPPRPALPQPAVADEEARGLPSLRPSLSVAAAGASGRQGGCSPRETRTFARLVGGLGLLTILVQAIIWVPVLYNAEWACTDAVSQRLLPCDGVVVGRGRGAVCSDDEPLLVSYSLWRVVSTVVGALCSPLWGLLAWLWVVGARVVAVAWKRVITAPPPPLSSEAFGVSAAQHVRRMTERKLLASILACNLLALLVLAALQPPHFIEWKTADCIWAAWLCVASTVAHVGVVTALITVIPLSADALVIQRFDQWWMSRARMAGVASARGAGMPSQRARGGRGVWASGASPPALPSSTLMPKVSVSQVLGADFLSVVSLPIIYYALRLGTTAVMAWCASSGGAYVPDGWPFVGFWSADFLVEMAVIFGGLWLWLTHFTFWSAAGGGSHDRVAASVPGTSALQGGNGQEEGVRQPLVLDQSVTIFGATARG